MAPSAGSWASKVAQSSLNERQEAALSLVKARMQSTASLTLLQGPPGTGKSTLVCEMVLRTVEGGGRVAVCAPSNKAMQVRDE